MAEFITPRMHFDTEAAKRSEAGQQLINRQFHRACLQVQLLNAETHARGTFRAEFKKQVGDLIRAENFQYLHAERVLRGLHEAGYGEKLNETRERLLKNEEALEKRGIESALEHARSIEGLIKDGPTMSFYQAYDRAAVVMSRANEITELGAKKMMSTAFEHSESDTLYSWGKELEEKYHTPIREAERAERRAQRQESTRSRARSGPSR